jgi:hypothetical protein
MSATSFANDLAVLECRGGRRRPWRRQGHHRCGEFQALHADALIGGIISFNKMVARPGARIERGASRALIEIS